MDSLKNNQIFLIIALDVKLASVAWSVDNSPGINAN